MMAYAQSAVQHRRDEDNSGLQTEWRSAFAAAVEGVGDGMAYAEAATRLRSLIQRRLLDITTIVTHPERFFLAHRLLAEHATRLGPGFWIRFTVHYNLFAGTVVALGTPAQIQQLKDRNRNAGSVLGCFALTECLAGVNSGLVVETTARFEPSSSYSSACFIIDTPSPSAAKNWISQGLVADESVVVATLSVNGMQYGPQAFLVRMRDDDGNLVEGIVAEDMGKKSVGNDLDNARLTFKGLRVPLDALLARYLSVSADGIVSFGAGGKRTMEMIGQRLFTGRVAVAQAAITFAQTLFDSTRAFASAKKCWAPKDARPSLSEVPQIRAIFEEGNTELNRLSGYMNAVERELCECLRSDRIPPLPLQQAIAVGKVKAVEGAISLCHALKQEVGSFALMAGTGFEQLDFLQCCKFAEGDSRILMQKMARDSARAGPTKASSAQERNAVMTLQRGLQAAMKQEGLSKAKAWDHCWRLVYDVAEAHMTHTLALYGYARASHESSKL